MNAQTADQKGGNRVLIHKLYICIIPSPTFHKAQEIHSGRRSKNTVGARDQGGSLELNRILWA